MGMMAIDVETRGLSATKEMFVVGCAMKEGGNYRLFRSPRKMWNYIKREAEREAKRGKTLTVIGHNTEYDFYSFVDFREKGIEIFHTNPL